MDTNRQNGVVTSYDMLARQKVLNFEYVPLSTIDKSDYENWKCWNKITFLICPKFALLNSKFNLDDGEKNNIFHHNILIETSTMHPS